MFVKIVISAVLAGSLAAGAAIAGAATHDVSIYDNNFMPPLIYAVPGDTVVILNEDDVVRQATATDDSWTTGPLQPGQSFKLVLSADMQLAFKSTTSSEIEDGTVFVPDAKVTFEPAPVE